MYVKMHKAVKSGHKENKASPVWAIGKGLWNQFNFSLLGQKISRKILIFLSLVIKELCNKVIESFHFLFTYRKKLLLLKYGLSL